MDINITILCENSISRPSRLIGEHGFGCLVEHGNERWLFDSGQGLGLVHNARELGCKLSGLNGFIMSHGHYDHGGGLLTLIEAFGPQVIYAHPEIFRERFWVGLNGRRSIGLPFTEEEIVHTGSLFDYSIHYRQLSKGMHLTGEIPRIFDWEAGDTQIKTSTSSGEIIDKHYDDQALVIESQSGLIVVVGCAHAGLMSTLYYILHMLPGKSIHAVIGGTHLGQASEDQFNRTVNSLKNLNINLLAANHCTGLPRAAQLQREFGSKFQHATVGASFRFNSSP